MRLEAMKRQVGRPSLENGSPMDNNLRGVKTASLFQESTGYGQAQVYRYIRLTELIPELLDISDGLWKTTADTRRRTQQSFPT